MDEAGLRRLTSFHLDFKEAESKNHFRQTTSHQEDKGVVAEILIIQAGEIAKLDDQYKVVTAAFSNCEVELRNLQA